MTNFPGPDPFSNPYGSGQPPGGPRHSALSRVSGGLLALTGSLLLAATLLPLQIQSQTLLGTEFSTRTTAWQMKLSGTTGATTVLQWLGVALTLAAITALIAGVLLLAGFAARSRAVRILGTFSAALGSGVALTTVLSSTAPEVSNMEATHGAGYWLSVFAMVVALAALATGLAADRAVPGPPDRSRDAIAGTLLLLSAIVAITGSFLKLTGGGVIEVTTWGTKYLDQENNSWQGAALAASTLVAAPIALLLLTPLAARTALLHRLAVAAAALSIGTTLTVVLDTSSDLFADSAEKSDLGPGYWVLIIATLLSLAATFTAVLAIPAPTDPPTPQIPGGQPFSPHHPNSGRPYQQLSAQPHPYPAQQQHFPVQQQSYPGQPQPGYQAPQQFPGQQGGYPPPTGGPAH
ncbi:hypothetical protein [Nocardia huaxiensis]|uniref:Uncharacterized protein n=1 Tax=Nocardia huaxiensis TaxID=2755382 RepID=A0A7D6ZER9_9NOCA|nr:hypothetical protein [Nocardia huaxiensis]QLY33768.1 hypothetical protein H0264_17395 [Nocardia huaxiensis]UFS99307.1 hypothetical protein LPY97_16125 [Nocardia huaxiensis]